ncbi:unnamed protein product [Ixodes hexagonus]
MTSVSFICVLIPLGVFLLPYSPTLAGKRPAGGRQTVPPDIVDDHDDHWRNLTEQQYCTLNFTADHEAAPKPGPSDEIDYVINERHTQFRELICVLTSKQVDARVPYHARYVPVSFCTAVVLHEYGVNGRSAESKRPLMMVELVNGIALSRRANPREHRGAKVPVYLGVGGDGQDGAHFSRMARDRATLTRLADDLRNIIKLSGKFFEGIYIDWDRPRGRCGHDTDTANLRTLVETLNKIGVQNLILAVPPRHEYAKDYDLGPILPYLAHVVVKTHQLRAVNNLVACHGTRAMAAPVLRKFRADFPQHWKKYIYSVSVAPYTYTTYDAPVLGSTAKGGAIFDWPVKQKDKTSYDQVCKLDIVQQAQDAECVVAYKRSGTGNKIKVAAFAGPQQLWQRMARSYDDNMGSTPVVVYDMDLDDFLGRCTPGVMSPLLEALAAGVL